MRWQACALAALWGSACGIPKDEHQQALDAQQARYQAEMAKAQSECERELRKKQALVQGLEDKVEEMGGNLSQVREALGERVSQLASAKTQLAATTAEVEQLRKLRARAEAEKAQFKRLTERFQSMIDAGQLEVVRRDGRMMLKLPDEILFPSGSKRLKQGGREALAQVAAVLKDVGADREFLIAGHTDNVPLKRGGRFADNWELSTARATTVVELMVDEGVPPEQLAAAGYGEFDPIASNETAEGRQQNRRLEIILMPKIISVEDS
jgi:chemotaxis protein MotB